MKKRFTEEQIVRILREPEATGQQIREICRKHNITEQTFFRWRKQFGDMGVAEIRRLQELEAENAKLKRLLAEQMLIVEGLREINKKSGKPCAASRGRSSPDRQRCFAAQGLSHHAPASLPAPLFVANAHKG